MALRHFSSLDVNGVRALASPRQQILQAALACFDEKSYEATTIAAICKASGASNGSLFHHFGSKEGLAAALFLSALESYHDALILNLAEKSKLEDGLRHMVSCHIRWVVEHRQEAKFLFEQSRAQWMSSIKGAQKSENQRFALAINTWRKPLIDAGELSDEDRAIFFSQVIGPAQLLARMWLSGSRDDDLREHIDTLSDYAIRAFSQ